MLEKKLANYLPSLPDNHEKSWEILQKSLTSGEAFVNIIQFRKFASTNQKGVKSDHRLRYGFTDSTFYAAMITTATTIEAPTIVVLGHGEYLEKRAINFYKNAINFDVKDNNSYKFYWQQIDKHLDGIQKVYLCNDGIYHTINLQPIYDESNDTFLTDKYDIAYAMNPGQKPTYSSINAYDKRVLLVGNPYFGSTAVNQTAFEMLPGTGNEISELEIQFKNKRWQSTIFTGIKATQENIEEFANSDILHIATHGYYDDRENSTARDALLSSGLVLAAAPESEVNGPEILTAYEVSNLNLSRTNLVYLSACETAQGKLENGEGVYGLKRAFLAAGADNVITSLWRIDDDITQQFVSTFYSYLLAGKRYDAALALTKKEIRAKHPAPKHWAPFIITSI